MGRAIKQFALLGQDQPAGMPVEQLGADVLLQCTDLTADRGLGQMQFVGRMRERSGLGSCVKDTQLVPIQWHSPTPHGRSYSAATATGMWPVRYRSASRAAMQPIPAAVTACRKVSSVTSPAA